MLRIKSPNNLFATLFCSLKNAILKKQSTFITYFSRLNLLFCYFGLKKRYFSSVELYNISETDKQKGYVIYVTINYNEGDAGFHNLFYLYSKCRSRSVGLVTLKRLHHVERSTYVLSTSRGILTTAEAIVNNVGGIYLIELI